MKIAATLLTFLISWHAHAQRLYITPSLAWGYGIFNTGHFTETNNMATATVNYNAPGSPGKYFSKPQLVYAFEYRINHKHAISFSMMKGITENRIVFNINHRSNSTMFGGIYRKWGLTYTRTIQHWNIYLGCYATKNMASSIETDDIQFNSVVKDNQGITSDSSFTGAFSVRPWGVSSSLGFGYSFYNKNKNRDRFSINLLLDIGWFKLNGVKDFVRYDYNRTLTSYSYSNGSQLKIYISKPILLYDFRKDKFDLL